MTPERYASFITTVARMRYLQQLKARYNFNSLSQGERNELTRLEKKVDGDIEQHKKTTGRQKVLSQQ